MKTWLITGCSSGIGKGIAKAVLESGDQAIVTARNKDKVMDIVEAYPETALAVSLDVCSQDSIKNAVKEAYDKFGTIDVLVNNAGYGYRSAVEEGEIEVTLDEMLRTKDVIQEEEAIYLPPYYFSESGCAKRLLELLLTGRKSVSDDERIVEKVVSQSDITYDEIQLEAVKTAISSKVMILTGGPGTGKTTDRNACRTS